MSELSFPDELVMLWESFIADIFKIMRLICQIVFAAALLLSSSLLASNLMASDAPYAIIASRNMFGLASRATSPPIDHLINLPLIAPNGIMTIFGKVQVLFKVASKSDSLQPATGKSYVMSEGDRQDGIEVVNIDVKKELITFNNHGIMQKLTLKMAINSGVAVSSERPVEMPLPRPGPPQAPPGFYDLHR